MSTGAATAARTAASRGNTAHATNGDPGGEVNPAMQALLTRAVDLSSFVQLYEAPPGAASMGGSNGGAGGIQTRSGRISRPPAAPPVHAYTPEADTPGTDGGEYASGEGPQSSGPLGRPPIDAEERLNRQRQRNRRSAFESRQRRKEAQDETRRQLEDKSAQIVELADRCKELEAQVRELQATLQAHGLPLPTVPGPAKRPPSRYWDDPGAAAPSRYAQQPDMGHPHNAHQHHAQQHHAQHHMQTLPTRQQQYLYENGLEALANAALPHLPPVSSPDVRSLVAANAAAAANGPPSTSATEQRPTGGNGNTNTALGDLTTTLTPTLTPTLTTPAPRPLSIADPDIAAALEALNPLAHEWRLDDDAISLSALFNIDDLGEDANDADFVPPTSPKADSSDDEDGEDEDEGDGDGDGEGEDSAERPRKRRRVDFADETDGAHDADADTDDEDLFLPIEDVPIPIDELYRDALSALGVSTQEELAVVVSKIVETASRGGVTPEQVEGLRRLMRLAEAQGANRAEPA